MPFAGRVGNAAVVASLAAACAASPPGPETGPPPAYTRSWSPYTPEDLNRDVVECADAARVGLAAEGWILDASRAELRGAFRARATACMEQRGWALAETP